MKRTRRMLTMVGLAAAAALSVSAGTGWASMPMVKKAKELGITSVQNCQSCHVDKLPKKDAFTLNDKGKWLVAEKDKRKAKEVDGAWLKEYKEKK